jgi:hypothetical protein
MTDVYKLDDATAQRILTNVAHARFEKTSHELTGLRAALIAEFGDPQFTSVSPGDLARQSLIVLANDPCTRQAIESIANEEPSSTRYTFDITSSFALGIAAYFALSTALDIKVSSDKKWSFHMKVKPAGEATVKALVQKLIGYLP